MKRTALFLLGAFLLVLFAWFFVPIWVNCGMSLERSAWRGDSFGSVNALFTGLAFAGVLITLFLQMEELRSQRKIIREEQDASNRRNEALELHTKALVLQLEMTAEQLSARAGHPTEIAPIVSSLEELKKNLYEKPRYKQSDE